MLGVCSGTPSMARLAEVGGYQLPVSAAKVLRKYWKRVMEMEDRTLAGHRSLCG